MWHYTFAFRRHTQGVLMIVDVDVYALVHAHVLALIGAVRNINHGPISDFPIVISSQCTDHLPPNDLILFMSAFSFILLCED
jgi:hypothetical protein